MYSLEEFKEIDKYKTKVLKYVLYKKRTKYEILQKFVKEIPEEIIEDIIEDLEENGYIGDENYIERAIDEFIAIKTMSLKEIKYKLLSKGIKSNLIEDYFQNNRNKLDEYEKMCAIKIVNKKQNDINELEIKNFLIKKGYQDKSISNAFKKTE